MAGYRGNGLYCSYLGPAVWKVSVEQTVAAACSALDDSMIKLEQEVTFFFFSFSLVDCFLTAMAPVSVSLSPTGDFLATAHVDSLGVFLWSEPISSHYFHSVRNSQSQRSSLFSGPIRVCVGRSGSAPSLLTTNQLWRRYQGRRQTSLQRK